MEKIKKKKINEIKNEVKNENKKQDNEEYLTKIKEKENSYLEESTLTHIGLFSLEEKRNRFKKTI